MCQVGDEVPGGFSWLLSSCWGKAGGTGVWAAVFSCSSELYQKENTWPSSDTLVCHWGSVSLLCCGYGDKQFYGLLPLCSDLGITTELSQCSWDSGVPPKITQNPLSAQPHHLMWSQLRSSRLSPGNWHCLNSQRICSIIKFFKSFSGFVLVFPFFLFRLSEAHEMNQLVFALFQRRTGWELDKTLQDLLLSLCGLWFSCQSCLNVGIKVGFLKGTSHVGRAPYFGDPAAIVVQLGVI